MKNLLMFFGFIISIQAVSQEYGLGALKTDPEIYKRIGQAPLPIGSNIPISVDLSYKMPPVGNQFTQNSCVAWTVAYANYSYLNNQNNNCEYLQNGIVDNSCIFSPSYIYNQINGGQNRGTHFDQAFKIMLEQGVPPLYAMPYDPNNWWVQPSSHAKQIASRHKIQSYWQLGTKGHDFYLESKAYLAQGFPIIASVKVDNYLKRQQNFSRPYVWNRWNGLIEQMGHAILIVGYNDNNQTFKFINSYGPNWGNEGYGYISYDMYKRVLNEAYIIKPQNINRISDANILSDDKNLNTNDINNGLYFNLDNVNHHLFPPGQLPAPIDFFSKYMTFNGSVSIPAGLGKTAQVVIYFYLNENGNKGKFIYSTNPSTRTLHGQAVTGTPTVELDPNTIFEDTFHAKFRYSDLYVSKGYPYTVLQTNLIAEPILFIDDFPIKKGNLHYFFVRL